MAEKAKGVRKGPTKAVDSKSKTANAGKKPAIDLALLRKPVSEAKTALDKARIEANGLTKKAQAMVEEAKNTYLRTLSPYREACRRTGTRCEFAGGRSSIVAEMVRFEVEKTERGIRVRIKGVPRSEETIPFSAFKESSVSKLAYGYTDRRIGKRSEIGNKGGGLSNRIRSVLQSAKKS